MFTRLIRALIVLVIIVCGGFTLAMILTDPSPESDAVPKIGAFATDKQGDEQLAFLLVKLELRVRAVVAQHYTRAQSLIPGVDQFHKRWLARNAILPAAVADRIFSQVVPEATGGRAWVRMVVDSPRNPHNKGDETALMLLKELRGGPPSAEYSSDAAHYYAEPIKAVAGCLKCHGGPAGEPDPFFPQYTRDGWQAGDIVGAVVARVAPEKSN